MKSIKEILLRRKAQGIRSQQGKQLGIEADLKLYELAGIVIKNGQPTQQQSDQLAAKLTHSIEGPKLYAALMETEVYKNGIEQGLVV